MMVGWGQGGRAIGTRSSHQLRGGSSFKEGRPTYINYQEYIIVFMSQLPGKPTPSSPEDLECHCFGYVQPAQQYFLSKHRSLESKHPLPPLHLHPADALPASPKNLSKRSLRKPLHSGPPTPFTSRRNLPFNDYCPARNSPELPLPRQTNDLSVVHPREQRELDYSSRIRQENLRRTQLPLTRPTLIKSTSCQNIQSFSAYAQILAPPPAPAPPRFLPPPIPPLPQLRINFRTPPPQVTYSPQISPRERLDEQRSFHSGTFKSVVMAPSLREMKEEVKINISSLRTQSNNCSRSPEPLERTTHHKFNTTLIEKKESVESTAHKEDPYKSLLKVDPTKSIIDTGKSRIDTAQSRIDINKSRIDTTKSRMDPKRSLVGETCKGKIAVRRLKDHKTALKKMDDVEEIHSMIDEDEIEDDQQSVVLGRLNQYGSMVDPSMSDATPTLHSKLISMNTQSSINKSFLRPYEYNYDRHFK